MFFHASEVIPPPPRGVDLATATAAGAEVEFVVGPPTARGAKPVATRVAVLPPGSLLPFTVGDDVLEGVVEREARGAGGWGGGRGGERGGQDSPGSLTHRPPGGDDPVTHTFTATDLADPAVRPRAGECVDFRLATDKTTSALHATRVSRRRERGVVATVKRTDRGCYGFMRCLDRGGQVFFHGSQLPRGADPVAGGEATFVVAADDASGRSVAVSVELLPAGTFPAAVDVPGELAGRVFAAPGGGALGVSYLGTAGREVRVAWVGELEGKKKKKKDEEGDEEGEGEGDAASTPPTDPVDSSTLPAGPDDDVSFTLSVVTATGERRAAGVALVARAADRRELGAVASLKGSHGTIKCCDRAGDLLFRLEAVAAGVDAASLTPGTDVDFRVSRDDGGRPVAVDVRLAPPGSAVFEEVDEELRCGFVAERLQGRGTTTLSTGVVEYAARDGDPAPPAAKRAGVRARLAFGVDDLADGGANPRVGDCVTFRIATDPRVMRAAVKAGSAAAAFAGRRATRVASVVLEGTIVVAKPTFGFIEYDAAEAEAATCGVVVAAKGGGGGGGGGGEGEGEAAGAAAAYPAADPSSTTTTPPPRPSTKSRLYYNAAEVDAATTTDLRRGDTVSFALAERPATRESVAHRVVRVRDAPPSSSSRAPLVAERRPDGMNVFTGGARGPGGVRGARLATRPDGSRGFTAATSPGGRGRLLAAAAAAAAAASAPGKGGDETLNPGAPEFVP